MHSYMHIFQTNEESRLTFWMDDSKSVSMLENRR